MVASRYFIAKYIPDLDRYEPRNVGVILWTPHGIAARFIGENKAGVLDSRHLPSFVGDHYIFREWVVTWRRLVSENGLSNILGPLEELDFDSEGRIRDALANKASKAHWLLAPGGVILDPVQPGESASLLDRLYDHLIGPHLPASIENELVDKVVRDLIKAIGLRKNPHFKEDHRIKSKTEDYSFNIDYALVGKKIHRIWQTLPTFPQKKQEETYAEATAYKLGILNRDYGLKPDQMQVLISMTHEQTKRHHAAISMVGRHAQVFNLESTEDRTSIFSRLPKLGAEEGTPLFG